MRKAIPTLGEAQRRHALKAMKILPGSKIYYDAKVVGLELPDGTFHPLRVGRLGLPIRTWDNLIVYRLDGSGEIVRAEPVALRLTPKPAGHGQTAGVDAGLRTRKGRLIVVVTDPLDLAVTSLRIKPAVLAQTRITACEDLADTGISGTWRAYSLTGNGLAIEAHPGMEFTIIQRPRAVDIAGTMAGGAVRVSDIDYVSDSRTLTFSYHTQNPFGGELSSHVRLVGTEPGLFEGDEIGGWIGATARPFSLRWNSY
ncbi:hypothetical protein Rhe02_88180 [Rhizocola hellebori]|uniref:Uncharacterized protein n=1 Tax=Rhizocola hellebori TaxID=1392758 RepID=A0A8J3VM23_9ACTN|nr:hypothetical protein [Rhizocola hellebori]GIH10751.1 hypothetical protein Rhe02_88180 [Rhizocola hellebori]